VAQEAHSVASSYGVNTCIPGAVQARDEGDERRTFSGGRRRSSHPKQLDAGPFEAEVGSFWLHLAAEGKAGRTLDTYTKAVRWFAAAHLVQQTDKTRWEQVDRQDLQRWTVRLLGEYSAAYASNQFRAVRLFLRWLAVEEDRPDPVPGLRAPKAEPGPVPVFSSGELSALRRACQGRSFKARRDAAIIEVLLAAGIRLSELSGIRYDPGNPARSDLRLLDREIKVRGKAGRERIVRIGFEAARSLDRYLRARARHSEAAGPQLWLGAGGRGPLTPNGIYQAVARAGERAGVAVYPHRFRHHFSHTWLERGGAEGDLMELNGWVSPQMLTRYGASARGARARRSYDRVMTDTP
jgi:site-specific recombinase XerD